MNVFQTVTGFLRLRKQAQLSKEQLTRLQEEKLRKLLHTAWEDSMYYRERFVEAGITKDQLDTLPLSSFPSISKKELLEHFDALVTVPDLRQDDLRSFDQGHQDEKVYKGKYHIVHSSGSTGKPGYFVYDQKAWDTMLLGILRAALWKMSLGQIVRLLLKRPRIVYVAATDGRYGGAMAVGDGIDGIGAKQLFLDIKEPMEVWIDKLKSFSPDIVIGYPSAIKILADLMKSEKTSLHVQRVISCGEPLGPSLRSYLEKAFDATVVNVYGASESLALGVQIEGESMLLFDDLNIVEMEKGQMYLTCLYNDVQPLIRYKLSDRFDLLPAKKEESFSSAKGLLGRDEDILWFQDEQGNKEFLHPLAIEGFCIEGLKDYQFVQRDHRFFVMEAEVEGNSRKVQRDLLIKMRTILEEKGLTYVEFSIQRVEKILPDPKTGKKALIRKGENVV